MNARKAQGGFSLFIVLIVMVVIAFMVVAGVQSINTEMRISSNDADRKMAMSVAETALRAGEKKVSELVDADRFSVDCTNGLCIPAGGVADPPPPSSGVVEKFGIADNQRVGACVGCGVPAWKREGVFPEDNNNREKSEPVEVSGEYAFKPRYIIEYLNVNKEDEYFFRVTARAWGKNPNTVVTIQSYVQANYPN